MTVGDRMNLDHHPNEVWLKGEVKRKRNGSQNRKCWRWVWDEKDRNKFRKKVDRLEMGRRKLDED